MSLSVTGQHASSLPGSLMPDIASDGLARLEHAAIRLGALVRHDEPRISPPSAQPLGSSVLVRDLVRSSHTGNATAMSLRELFMREALPEPGVRRSPALHLLANTVRAAEIGLDAVRAGGHRAVDACLLRDMHAALCEGLAVPGAKGTLRRLANGPDPEQSLQAICASATDTVPHRSLLLRMGHASASLRDLSPFEFGSDILARLLPALLAEAAGFGPIVVGVVPSGHSPAELGPYFDALAVAARHAHRLDHAMRSLRAAWIRRLVTLRSDANARHLLDRLFETPAITVSQAERWLDVSFQTANAAVATLVAHGIVAPHGALRRNRIFLASEIFDLVDSTHETATDGSGLPATPCGQILLTRTPPPIHIDGEMSLRRHWTPLSDNRVENDAHLAGWVRDLP